MQQRIVLVPSIRVGAFAVAFTAITMIAVAGAPSCWAPAARAQELEPDPGPVVSDRPTVGMSARIVPRDFAVLETGFAWNEDEVGDIVVRDIRSLASSIRIGLRPRLELQVNYDGQYDREIEVGGTTINRQGKGDFEVATKWRLSGEDAPVAVAALVGLRLPTGDEAFGSEHFDPRGQLAAGLALGDAFSIDVNVGVGRSAGDAVVGLTTASLGFAPNARLSFVVEHAMNLRLDEDESSIHALLGGLGFHVTDRVQLDFALARGLSERAYDSFGTIGVCWRFPD